MSKRLQVTWSDGTVVAIPLDEIAESRASASADRATAKWYELYSETLHDPEIAMSWARKSMSWTELEEFALVVFMPSPVDENFEWSEAPMKVVDAEK